MTIEKKPYRYEQVRGVMMWYIIGPEDQKFIVDSELKAYDQTKVLNDSYLADKKNLNDFTDLSNEIFTEIEKENLLKNISLVFINWMLKNDIRITDPNIDPEKALKDLEIKIKQVLK